jgi:hypothetical protein
MANKFYYATDSVATGSPLPREQHDAFVQRFGLEPEAQFDHYAESGERAPDWYSTDDGCYQPGEPVFVIANL